MLRAVIYCRCSTEEESQQDALQQQIIESRKSVKDQGWLLVDEFIEAKSGTTTARRDEYKRLYEALETDQFDIVQIKTQDRLMRNTKDWYLFIDRLVSNGKKLYIYLEHKFYTADDALITGIKAILAEEFSKELSKKINNAHQHRQEDGRSFILPPNTYGLTKDENGQFVIVEEEAEAIRVMFQLCHSMGCQSIAHYLEENGYRDRNGNVFKDQTIHKIIRNPLRCGMIIQNKRHFDFQTKKEFKNDEKQWIVHKNAVPAIVTEEEWKSANAAMDARTSRKSSPKNPVGLNPGKYQLTGKMVCGICGSPYYRSSRIRSKDKSQVIEWKCYRYIQYGRNEDDKRHDSIRTVKMKPGRGCDNIHLAEDQLYRLLERVAKEYYSHSDLDYSAVIGKAIAMLEEILGDNDTAAEQRKLKKAVEKYEQQKQKLLDKLLNEVISDADYKARNADLNNKIRELSDRLNALNDSRESQLVLEQRISAIRKHLEEDTVRDATIAELIDSILEIKVYPTKLVLTFQPDKILGIDSQLINSINGMMSGSEGIQDNLKDTMQLEVPLGEEFFYFGRKEAERRRIMEYMRADPHITAKVIAQKEGVSLSAINARIRVLRERGSISYNGKGGCGTWVVHELPNDG